MFLEVHSLEVEKLKNTIISEFGPLTYYGSNESEEHGIGFKLQNINATFSATTNDGTLRNCYSIQIESVPPGEFVYTDTLTLKEVILLIRAMLSGEMPSHENT